MNYLDSQKQTIKYITDSIYTCEVAVVEVFYPETSSADVKLLVKSVYPNGKTDNLPMFLRDVPVRFPQMGNFTLYAPLRKGDAVYLHFSRSDWDNWLVAARNNQEVVSDGVAKHSINCPYIEVGARNFANPARDERYLDRFHMVQGEGGEQSITMHETGITINSGTSLITITPSGQITITGNINVTGNMTVTGNLTAANIMTPAGNFNGHTHIDAEGRPTQPI